MGNQREKEAATVNFPLKNTEQMINNKSTIAGVDVRVFDLQTEFGPRWKQGYYTVTADGAKMYIALGHTQGSISEATTTGVATALADNIGSWPIPADTNQNFVIPPGREVGTGVAQYVDYRYLHYKVASGGTTGMLRLYRSSFSSDSQEFVRSE